uniref:YbbR-like domain-containing protein n=1 Tax=candidate division WOR-3 bacterium TaxID=2052148 RepID=A0A7V1EJ13_UNCW3
MQKVLKTFINFFVVDPARKVLALVLAFGLWLFVAVEGVYNYEREIPISYINLSDHYVITESGTKLQVKFNGKGKNLFGIWASPPRIICDLTEVVPGRNVISTKDLIVPVKDLTVNFNTKFITVDIDEKAVKFVKPLIPIKGSPKNGYAISTIEVLDSVIATGAKKTLQKLSEVIAETLNVNNKSATFETSLRIASVLESVKFSKENIRLLVVIDSSAQKTFTDIGINILKNVGQKVKMDNYNIDTLVISGAKNRLDKMNRNDVIVRISISDLVSGEYFLSPEIIMPDFISLVYSKPQVIKVNIY